MNDKPEKPMPKGPPDFVTTRSDVDEFCGDKTLTKNAYSDARREYLPGGRAVCWFSAGATSAVAAKLTVQKYQDTREICVVYCDTGGEHETNKKFLQDIQTWIKHPIVVLKNDNYRNHWDVFEKERFLKGPHGARCTTELKKNLRKEFERTDSDIQIFGYSLEERKRIDDFRMRNPEMYLETILYDRGLMKADCLGMLDAAGIDLPFMYQKQKSGSPYNHNNCIGCPKGQMGYWNKIRIDFPRAFEKMSAIEQELGISCCATETREGDKRIKHPVFLKDLRPDQGNYKKEPEISCGIGCGFELLEIEKKDAEDEV